MARPVRADAEATRERILEEAHALFAARGLAETTTRQIARHSGVSLATVHHYYGSKADLYDACIARTYADLSRLADQIESALRTLEAGTTASDILTLAVVRSYAFAREHRSSVQLLMRAIIDKGESDPKLRERYQLPMLERGVAMAAAVSRLSHAELRIRFLALHHLIVHFALNTPREIAIITGNPEARPDECIELVERYLVGLAHDQFGIGEATA
jgi:AcrR family transcriptional regulator